MKYQRERQILHDLIYMCNLKTKQQEQQTNSQKKRSDLQLPEVERDFDDGGQS